MILTILETLGFIESVFGLISGMRLLELRDKSFGILILIHAILWMFISFYIISRFIPYVCRSNRFNDNLGSRENVSKGISAMICRHIFVIILWIIFLIVL